GVAVGVGVTVVVVVVTTGVLVGGRGVSVVDGVPSPSPHAASTAAMASNRRTRETRAIMPFNRTRDTAFVLGNRGAPNNRSGYSARWRRTVDVRGRPGAGQREPHHDGRRPASRGGCAGPPGTHRTRGNLR